jgi:OmpA-OmpF porin, OOP family
MKRILLVYSLILMLTFTAAAQAEMKAGAISVTPSIGGYLFESKENLKNPLIYSLRFGSNITPHWGFEGSYYYGASENKALAGNPDVDLYGYGVEALYNFMPEGKLVPFVAAGVGGTLLHRTGGGGNNRAMADYGAGLKYFVTENIALRADVRHVIPFNDTNNNLLYTFGVNFFFGGAKKAAPIVQTSRAAEPAAAPVVAVAKDTDGDGVVDDLDKCPGTPAGVQVDRDGCPLDTDGDGVPDYLDKCPGTPAGVQVDRDGCPLDTDGDGVPDYLDKCPGTPAGVKVDQDGCPPPPPVVQKAVPQAASAVETAIVEKGRATLNVEFDFGKATIRKAEQGDIGNLAAVMKKYPDIKILIEGHTDNVGSAKYNEKLSQQRADAVKKNLVDKYGIEASRLGTKGYGLTKPIASNATKEGRQKNRRVEAATEYTIKK